MAPPFAEQRGPVNDGGGAGRSSLVTPWLTPCQQLSRRIELLPLNQAAPRDGP